jgi:MoxR-like ATPase
MKYKAGPEEVEMVNAALYLRRPLLVTGPPGAGKSSLAYSVAWELSLGKVLHWPITTRSTIEDGLYSYDAIGRLQESQMSRQGSGGDPTACPAPPDPGRFIRLGPLGTALLPARLPRVLLIDEIDKSDIDLPNDLLNAFEEGRFPIQELVRMGEEHTTHVYPWKGKNPDVAVTGGEVVCSAFPFVVLTSNGERELPKPFLRRCIRLDIREPNEDKLADIVRSHFGEDLDKGEREVLIQEFLTRRTPGSLATDQLLNAVYLTLAGIDVRHAPKDGKSLLDAVLRRLDDSVQP